ncbi:hypothetical protein B0J11DRAFT_557485 [Dendryphion nanum]|uniref:NUC153 domain-containing protein n=1 Tax=Dendryphion nanum TaxID=256645 RepID=A0A9P9E3U6_9PLEO|nr:hypothetical protein B0J11DRAFT_557485 [Dendryphion nanum]
MPLPKRPALPVKAKRSTESSKPKKDSRFSNFGTDAKFRLPSKKHTKTNLDSRFSRLLSDPDFYNKASVDRYGRKVEKDAGKKKLERFYRQNEDEHNEEDGSEEEDEDEYTGPDSEQARKRDKAVKRELAKIDIRGKKYDPIRDGGISSSSSEESSSDEEEEVEEEDVEAEAELAGPGNDIPEGEVTSRLAAVNMDWDNIRASDIMAVANSFLPADGKIVNVTIYPRAPREIFASSKNNDDLLTLDEPLDLDDSEDEERLKQKLLQEGNGEEFDTKALRAYQLDRLRYYYAVIEFSSPNAAKAVYDNMDGLEYLTSANFFDLRFIPDETTFDEEPHDQCKQIPKAYKPNEFSTDALTHSKVKLTWDADDVTRKEAQKRAFSRDELDDNELKTYLGSDSESEADADQSAKTASLRAALGLGSTEEPSRSSKRDRDFKKPDGEMQVTFSSVLSSQNNKPVIEYEETTLEKFVRQQKERKAKRKERAKARKAGLDPDAIEAPVEEEAIENDDDPWNDPFFGSDPEDAKAAEMKAKKAKRKEKREEREKDEKEVAEQRAKLELLMADDDGNGMQHFDMNEISKAEKAKKKGKKGKKSKEPVEVVEDDFNVDTQDPRFGKLFESHEFAIDPTNPRFKETKGMKALLEEGRRKRKRDRDDVDEAGRGQNKSQEIKDQSEGELEELQKLAARVKAKNKKGNCSNGVEPDIAGIGVVISFVLASIMTTVASILAMLLEQAFDDKGQFNVRKPVEYFRERFLHTEWKMNYAWRPFLDPLIIGLGDQQLITGYAVLFSGWIKVAQNAFEAQGAHFVLVLYICALSSSSHLAALITLRKYFRKYKLIAKIRIATVVIFALFLFCSMIACIAMPPTTMVYDGKIETQRRVHRLSFLVPMFFMLIGFSTALVCILYRPKSPGLAYQTSDLSGRSILSLIHRVTDHKRSLSIPRNIGLVILYYLFLNPLVAFIVQIILMLLSIILVLTQKFSKPAGGDKGRWCGLEDPAENSWGFGQTLSLVMLLLPAMSAGQTYLEGRQNLKQGAD